MISFEETKEDIVSKITPEEAHEFFRYDPESGQIFWRHDRRKAERRLGFHDNHGKR